MFVWKAQTLTQSQYVHADGLYDVNRNNIANTTVEYIFDGPYAFFQFGSISFHLQAAHLLWRDQGLEDGVAHVQPGHCNHHLRRGAKPQGFHRLRARA